jgi:hypothetical protein
MRQRSLQKGRQGNSAVHSMGRWQVGQGIGRVAVTDSR